MAKILEIPYDIFIEKASTNVKTEYQVYCMQDDGWYKEEKYVEEKAISTNGWPMDSLEEAESRLSNYLSIPGREGLLIKRVITLIIDPDSPLIRNVQITETVLKRCKS